MKRRQSNKGNGKSAPRTQESLPAQPPAELSAAYGKTCLTLLDVDPFHVHAAWEVTLRERAAAEKKFADAALVWVLRFHDEHDGNTFDIPVNLEACSWYVDLWTAGKTYHAELGPCSVQGDLVPVCRSNTIAMPPVAVAQPQEPQWLAVTGALEQVISAPPIEQPIGSYQLSAISSQPCETRVEPVLTPPVEATAQDFPLATPPNADVVTPAEPAAAIQPPAEIAAVLAEPDKISATATPAGSSENVSSFSMGGGAEKAAIELEINAEVIVYGRAQPGQTLRVNGRAVPVNDDGTFHVRWALPVAKP